MTHLTPDPSEHPTSTRLGRLRDLAIAVILLAVGAGIVAIYQIEASKAEPVSIVKNTGGAASQLLSQGGAGGNGAVDPASLPDNPLDRWVAGPHSDSYVVAADGTNSTCNQCHDPVNYVPSMEDMPASCTVCKFTVKPPPPLVEPADAHQIDCKVCHRVDQSGTVLAGVSWLEVAAIEQYADVESVSELCQRCHTGADVPGHADVHVSGAHADLGCADCHDAHSVAASCTASGCHETLEQIPGHDADHANVHCVACHDTSGMEVGADEARGGLWVTFAGEGDDAFPHISHALGREASCDRCHVEVLPGAFK